jgi:divalent metal cation (Fe/Co/Zn/Cd) transporter
MVQMFLKKDKIQKLVGHRPNKKDISKIIQENSQKKGVNSLFNLNGFANLLSVGP